MSIDFPISRFPPYYELAGSLAAQTDRTIGLAVGPPSAREIADEKSYGDLPGGVLEAMGRLFERFVKMYVYPTRDPVSRRIQTIERAPVPAPRYHLRVKHVEMRSHVMVLSGEGRSRRRRQQMSPGARSLWAVVLPGGEGVRLRPLVRRAFGDERPKQFCPLLGPRSFLGQTLDRAGRLIPPDRTVVVGLESHERYLAREFGEPGGPHVLKQPESRDTAAAVLFAAQWIAAREPRATVVFFPSDHFIREEGVLIERVSDAATFVRRRRPCSCREVCGTPLSLWPRLGRCWRPDVRVCRACRSDWLDSRPSGGSERERGAVRQAYALAPPVNFSRAILEACAQPLAVLEVPGLTWCDLGSPDRVLQTLAGCRIEVPWVAASIA